MPHGAAQGREVAMRRSVNVRDTLRPVVTALRCAESVTIWQQHEVFRS